MRRINWKTVSTLIAMIVVAGCQENVVSPRMSDTGPAAMSLAPQGHPNFVLSHSDAAQNASADFTVGPAGGVFQIGNHAVYFPARSICDPETSSYGMGSWNDSCTPLRGAIRIHAQALTINGVPSVDFSPELRFVPSNDPTRWVWLYMSMPSVSATSLANANILYVPTLGGPGYDEALTDPTLRTYFAAGMGLRRIKHFSGYTWTGFTCDSLDCPAAENP